MWSLSQLLSSASGSVKAVMDRYKQHGPVPDQLYLWRQKFCFSVIIFKFLIELIFSTVLDLQNN